MRKILILGNSIGGLYNFRKELIEELLKSFQVYYSVPWNNNNMSKYKELNNMGCNYIRSNINRRGTNLFEEYRLFLHYQNIIKNLRPNIILTYTIKPNIYGNIISSKFNIPSIMNITGMGSAINTSKFKFFYKKLYSIACKKSNVVFFQNEYNKNYFIKNKLVSQQKAKLLPGSGVNIDRFKYFKPMEKKSSKNIKFIYIGRIMKEKGIKEYIEVSKYIKKKYEFVEFYILGSLEEKKYESEILDSNIIYLKSKSDIRPIVKEMDCLIHPSYHEGMSNVMLEAAAMGKPVIASNIPGCKEIVVHEKTGYLFEVKSVKSMVEQIEKFIKLDRKKREVMGLEGRKKIEREFDRKIVVNEYLNIINKLLGDESDD